MTKNRELETRCSKGLDTNSERVMVRETVGTVVDRPSQMGCTVLLPVLLRKVSECRYSKGEKKIFLKRKRLKKRAETIKKKKQVDSTANPRANRTSPHTISILPLLLLVYKPTVLV